MCQTFVARSIDKDLPSPKAGPPLHDRVVGCSVLLRVLINLPDSNASPRSHWKRLTCELSEVESLTGYRDGAHGPSGTQRFELRRGSYGDAARNHDLTGWLGKYLRGWIFETCIIDLGSFVRRGAIAPFQLSEE